ncbi:hypothetical protein BAY61_14370 [Prauserella marina]|nr:hypothetical protein BAY61_14370 [Prauserella marina]
MLTLAGCGRSVEGAPSGEDGAALTSAALGDPRTIDPCSLIAPNAFAEHGPAHALPRQWLDNCRTAVTVGSENVEVSSGMLRPAAAISESQELVSARPGDARIVRVPSNGTTCELHVVLADGVGIEVSARPQQSDSGLAGDKVCAIAEAGARGMVTTLESGEVRHWKPAHNSLARVSACGPLPSAQVAKMVAASPSDVTLYPAEHQCTWGVSEGETSNVQLDFILGPALDPRDGTVEDIGGRSSLVVPTDTENLRVCNIYTEHIEFPDAVEGEREIALVRVLHLTETGKDPCDTARQVAGMAWPRLPPS